MSSNTDITHVFFKDLKNYNSTNFRTIEKADLDAPDAKVHKAFSSVVTRYFIFCERHPEITDTQKRILYFKLKIDMIGRYFANYPDTSIEELKAFQIELRNFIKESRGGDVGVNENAVRV